MDTARSTAALAGAGMPSARRADAGSVRLGDRDVDGLLLCGDMYGAPYDLLAAFLDVRPDRLRGIVARWRQAGYATTGRLGAGPSWCWLTRSGLAVTGQRYATARPALARLAHIRAVLAIRLSLQASDAYTRLHHPGTRRTGPLSDLTQAPIARVSYHDHGNRDRGDRPPAYGASLPASFSGLTSHGRSS
jgi:hypothetical protein